MYGFSSQSLLISSFRKPIDPFHLYWHGPWAPYTQNVQEELLISPNDPPKLLFILISLSQWAVFPTASITKVRSMGTLWHFYCTLSASLPLPTSQTPYFSHLVGQQIWWNLPACCISLSPSPGLFQQLLSWSFPFSLSDLPTWTVVIIPFWI
jgi:hypothetical protein